MLTSTERTSYSSYLCNLVSLDRSLLELHPQPIRSSLITIQNGLLSVAGQSIRLLSDGSEATGVVLGEAL